MCMSFSHSASAQKDQQSLKMKDIIKPSNAKKVIFKQIHELYIYFEFVSTQWSRYKGFLLTYETLSKICFVLWNSI